MNSPPVGIIRCSHVTVRYVREKEGALRDLSFSAEPGERIALAGANGAGKSTLLLTLAGMLLPAEGSLSVGGVPVCQSRIGELRKKTGLLFQNPEDQLFMPTVEEDLCFGPRNYGMDEETLEEKLDALLQNLGMAGLRERSIHHLSGGEKRLAALAGILIMEPDLLLLDEPGSFLDPAARRKLIRILSDLKTAMIIATHDFDLARRLCTRTLILKVGRIRADAPGSSLLDDAEALERWGL
ncbi:MAG: energy-coupling factor ABC transporter ATP-binding protein [Spirochaetaceae bacterium]|jgi:cobalt/nickel transport system ATP-binding protein|nr:energy-coupling factor ABC transporter ATP-binding protein [Spirochaetaceae bacterium]